MAFVRTSNLTADNGDVYADIAEWQAAHGPCGLMAEEFCTGEMTLNAEGTGVQIVLTYVDEAAHTAHMASISTDSASLVDGSWSGAGVTGALVSAE